jgi:hypothetical protein
MISAARLTLTPCSPRDVNVTMPGTELAPRAKGSGKGDSKAHRLARKAKTLLISQGWTGLNSTDPS